VPRVMSQYLTKLNIVLDQQKLSVGGMKQLASIQIYYNGFVSCLGKKREKETGGNIEDTLRRISNPWSLFHLAIYSLCVANFKVAALMFGKHLPSFLWMSTLTEVSRAELSLLEDGCGGIPIAPCHLGAALNKICSIRSVCDPLATSF